MEIIPNKFKLRCELGMCKNYAAYTIKFSRVGIKSRIHICGDCLCELADVTNACLAAETVPESVKGGEPGATHPTATETQSALEGEGENGDKAGAFAARASAISNTQVTPESVKGGDKAGAFAARASAISNTQSALESVKSGDKVAPFDAHVATISNTQSAPESVKDGDKAGAFAAHASATEIQSATERDNKNGDKAGAGATRENSVSNNQAAPETLKSGDKASLGVTRAGERKAAAWGGQARGSGLCADRA